MRIGIGMLLVAGMAATALNLGGTANADGHAGDHDASLVFADIVEYANLHLKNGEDSARNIAENVCDALDGGQSVEGEENAIAYGNIDHAQAVRIVATSTFHFCPNYM